MSRSPARPGPPPKWAALGGLVATQIRWPRAHREVYQRRADELGMSFSEYVVRTMAAAHGLELPDESQHEGQEQLPLSA